MSYMSGMMLGMAFGQSVRRFLTGGAAKPETPAFTLARAIPGRRRYYAKALVGNDALAQAVEKQGLDGIMITTWHHLPDMNKQLPNHLSAAWNGCGFTSLEGWHWGSTPTLLRKLMAKPSRFEDSGFASWEVDSKYTVNP